MHKYDAYFVQKIAKKKIIIFNVKTIKTGACIFPEAKRLDQWLRSAQVIQLFSPSFQYSLCRRKTVRHRERQLAKAVQVRCVVNPPFRLKPAEEPIACIHLCPASLFFQCGKSSRCFKFIIFIILLINRISQTAMSWSKQLCKFY